MSGEWRAVAAYLWVALQSLAIQRSPKRLSMWPARYPDAALHPSFVRRSSCRRQFKSCQASDRNNDVRPVGEVKKRKESITDIPQMLWCTSEGEGRRRC